MKEEQEKWDSGDVCLTEGASVTGKGEQKNEAGEDRREVNKDGNKRESVV